MFELDKNQKNRIYLLAFIALTAFIILALRLYSLQVLQSEKYNLEAINNRIKIIKNVAPRGTILDKNGIPIVYNQKSFIISVIPDEIEKEPGSLKLLCEILNINAGIYYSIIEEAKERKGYPVRIAVNVPMETVVKIGENRMNLHGVSIENTYIRFYPERDKTCHMIGYLREITKEQLDDAREKGLKYKMGDYIGVSGIEKSYEEALKGTDGGKRIEVNASGRVVKILDDKPSIQGKNVKLTIDKHLQEVAYEAMKGKTGATVAIDPKTGAVLAMVSTPTYDPNIFIGGLKSSDWRKISNNRERPLQNRFIGSVYPPGSIFKPVIALSVLENNIATPDTVAYCPGYFTLGHYRKGCWATHGTVNFYTAIAKSCDTWFYKESLKLGIDNLYKTASEFGLGKPTGIDIPEEAIRRGKVGNFPNPEWKKKKLKSEWRKGDTLNVSIGQGDVLASPLQMAMVAAAISNGGKVYKPYLVDEIINPKTGAIIKKTAPKVNSKVNAPQEYFDDVVRGMELCVNSGTGAGCKIDGIRVAGKTGSAQATGGKAHGWFMTFAPVDNPKIAIVTIVEHGGSGSAAAAPVCKAMLNAYLKNNIPGNKK